LLTNKFIEYKKGMGNREGMIVLRLDVPLTPWAPSRITNLGAYNPKNKQKRLTEFLIRSKYKESPLQGYVEVDFIFYFKIPRSFSKKEKIDCMQQKIRPTRS